jgi:hypothetical protein
MQRLAAELVARCHGLGHGHIGAICDALTHTGIDPDRWSARAITDALNTDMRATGWCWPNHINRPAAFLASRLRRLPMRPCGPPNNDGGYAAGIDKNQPAPAPPRPRPTTAQRARIADAQATIRTILTRRRSSTG